MRSVPWILGIGVAGVALASGFACGGDEENAPVGGVAGTAGTSSEDGGTGGTAGSGGGTGGSGGTGGTAGTGPPLTDPHVSGDYLRWHTLTFDFDGPSANETDDAPNNPFTDYRLQVGLTAPSGATFDVPGFFDGDGQGDGSGNRWRVRFTPDEIGRWSYTVSFRAGPGVALDTDPSAGDAETPDATTGEFDVLETDKSEPDLRAIGRIVYAQDHYFRTQSGHVWIKGGADSPENFLGYAGFDDTVDQSGGASTDGLQDGVHRYAPHVDDWNPGDPDWNNGDGKGIIGALNYLSLEHVNSIYFLPCNLGGDGRETYPYVDPGDLTHWDISKLAQWETVFAHAERQGIALHFVLNETEQGNENLHDDGDLGPQRMLYYRELVARFGHHLGLFWNIGEENDYGATKQAQFAAHIRDMDPYDHPISVHTHIDNPAAQYDPLVGDPNFELTSIQLSPDNAGTFTEQWRENSAQAGRPWVVMLDEIGPASTGVTDRNAAEIRRRTLWPAYLSGSGGVEWYMGYHSLPLGGDMRLEDFRTRQDMWRYTWYARQFVEALPVADMTPDDSLLSDSSGHVFFQAGVVYAIYLPSGGDATLDLSGETGDWSLRWYDVTTGTYGATTTVAAGGIVDLGTPEFSGDVAAVLNP